MLGIMKIMNLSSLALSLLFVVACIKDNKENVEEDVLSLNTKISLSTAEWMSIAYDNPKEISEEDIKTLLDNFISQEYVVPKNQTRTAGHISSFHQSKQYSLVERMSIAATRSAEMSLYDIDCTIREYEFDLSGERHKAIVSTDERYPRVLAFMKIDEISETARQDYCETIPGYDESQSILSLTYEAVYNHLCNIQAIRDSLRDETLLKISQELNTPIGSISYDNIKEDICISDNSNPSTRSYPIDFPTDQILSGCFPLVEVAWGGYNSVTWDYMPYYWETKRVSASVAVTTILHILSFIQPTMTIPAKTYEGHGYKSSMEVDWNLLTQTEHFLATDSQRKIEMGGRLYRFISDEIGLIYKGTAPNGYVIPNYETNYTNANFLTVLRKYIACDNVTAYNLNAILNSLGRARPVFLDSHEVWGDRLVIDGYFKTRSTSGVNSTYLHLKFPNNVGNTSTTTGYYLVNADSSLDIQYNNSCVSYSKDFKIIPECRRK